MKTTSITILSLLLFAACQPKENPSSAKSDSTATSSSEYEFARGYPTDATIQKAYDEADVLAP
ncbi:hypothetical protein WBG78_09880 [Chryseolinea sp. T2]|uniref:hypothetical protein n=1 Tax=Chryseolinea sp. T2 TaxID=3129255 RepID=UPI003076A88E